jgi:glycosyltransferase involved in cell wall biosynthesis
MNELVVRFTSQPNVTFVSWDSFSQNYRVHDSKLIARGHQALAPMTPPLQKMSKTISAAKRLSENSALAERVLKLPARAAKKFLRAKAIPISGEVISPKTGDLLFVLADWHGSDENFIASVEEWRKNGVKLIQISYDMLPVVTPQYSGHSTQSFIRYVSRIYPLCNEIITISENTKLDVAHWLEGHNLPAPRISVIRLGEDFKATQSQKPDNATFTKTIGNSSNFLLCVGTIEARKNHALLYYTYKLAKQRAIELPPTVIVGRRGWKTDDICELMTTDPETKNSLIILQSISDEELSWLYEHCIFTIYPSFYEGWGLPIAESISHGKTCIASNTSSMPEIAGDLINYFSPASADECLLAITKLIKPKNLKMAEEKLRKYKPTSWDSCFESVERIVSHA